MRDMCEATPEQCRSGEWAHLQQPEPLARRRRVRPRGEPRARRAGSPRPDGTRGPSGPNRDDRGAKAPFFISTGRRGRDGERLRGRGGRQAARLDAEDRPGGQWRAARGSSPAPPGIRIAGGRAEAIAANSVPAYAKLSLEELSGLPEYATIKEVVSDKLRAASVEHHRIPSQGRDWLLFKVEDAPEVDEAFRQLEQETEKAADRARERLSDEIAEAPGARAAAGGARRAGARGVEEDGQGIGKAAAPERGPREMRWQAAAWPRRRLRREPAATAAIAASGTSPILDPEAAMAAIPAALRAGRVFSAEAVPLCAGTACACGVPRLGPLTGDQGGPARRRSTVAPGGPRARTSRPSATPRTPTTTSSSPTTRASA